MTLDAQELLVEQYKNLRNRDSGGSRSSWRITVRQLESMIRSGVIISYKLLVLIKLNQGAAGGSLLDSCGVHDQVL